MKKSLFILFAYTFLVLLTACNSSNRSSQQDTHTHEDGTVHEGEHHHEDENDLPEQESFMLGEDSAHMDDHHGHEEGHDHGHEH